MNRAVDGTTTTVGATTATVATMPIPSSVVGLLKGYVAGRDDNGNGCVFEIAAAGKVDAGGTVTPIGAFGIVTTRADAALAGATVALAVAANTLQLRVTGVAGQTIHWAASADLFVA